MNTKREIKRTMRRECKKCGKKFVFKGSRDTLCEKCWDKHWNLNGVKNGNKHTRHIWREGKAW